MQKSNTRREATASACVRVGSDVMQLIRENALAKGDVLSVARLAGIMGAKQTPNLIPLCHTVQLSSVSVDLDLDEPASTIWIRATASTVGPTGVEMEALTAAAIAALTVYDMCKAVSKGIIISDVRLLSKSGGKSGRWSAPPAT